MKNQNLKNLAKLTPDFPPANLTPLNIPPLYSATSHADNCRSWAEIDLAAIAHNTRAICNLLGENGRLLAVVKANAYGLGAPAIARTALLAGASGLAVSTCEEGLALRQAGLRTCPILVLGYVAPGEAAEAVAASLTITVNRPELAQALSNEAVRQNKTVRVHLKLDTGLHRYGLTPPEALAVVRLISRLPGLQMEGLYTHFATGDEGDHFHVYEQLQRFRQTRHWLAQNGFRFAWQHLGNSASTISVPETRNGAGRVGLALLGYYPSNAVAAHAESQNLNLRPCLTLKSTVVRLSWLEPGEAVGYNRTFVAEKPVRLALVPVGYADGMRRSLSNRGAVLINGQRAPIIGRISMDQLTVDVTNIAGVREGAEVVLIGQQHGAAITLDEVAAWSDTISYEILTGLGSRIKRVYINDAAAANL